VNRDDPPRSLDELLDRWAEAAALLGRAPRSQEALGPIRRAFGALPPAALDRRDLQRWRLERLAAGIRPATVNRNVAALAGALRFAVEAGWLDDAATRGLAPLPVVDGARVRWLSVDEERRLRDALARRDGEAGYRDALTPAVLVSLNTGLRRGELLALHWADVGRGQLRVAAAHAKGRRMRTVPLNAEARTVLERWAQARRPGEAVFVDRAGRPLRSVRRAWLGVLARAAIADFRWHDLRHHFASRLVMAGVPLNTVRELLGHRSLAMTLRYAHLAEDHLRQAVDRLEAPPARGGPDAADRSRR
jgi:integrase